MKSDCSSHEDALDLVLEFQDLKQLGVEHIWNQGTLDEGTFYSQDFLRNTWEGALKNVC